MTDQHCRVRSVRRAGTDRGHAVDAHRSLCARRVSRNVAGQRLPARHCSRNDDGDSSRGSAGTVRLARRSAARARTHRPSLSREEPGRALPDRSRHRLRARSIFRHVHLSVESGGSSSAATIAQSRNSRRCVCPRRRRGGLWTHDPAQTTAGGRRRCRVRYAHKRTAMDSQRALRADGRHDHSAVLWQPPSIFVLRKAHRSAASGQAGSTCCRSHARASWRC